MVDDREEGQAARKAQSCPETPLCEECRTNSSKYKCPGCSLRSCSLLCVKAHKQRTGCEGTKIQTQFVPLSQFDDSLLLSDYGFLEEAKRVTESAQRLRMRLRATNTFYLPHHLKTLRNAAGRRKIKLQFLPPGMSKRELNKTRFDYRKKHICWTIEWRFYSTDVVLYDHGVNENRNLLSVIQNHIKPGPWKHQLRRFCEEPLDSLKFFIRKDAMGRRSPFRELDLKAPIVEQFSDMLILEYPVVHVFLPSHDISFEVVQVPKMVNHKPEVKSSENNQTLEGICYKEETIEDVNSSADPQVLDFRNQASSSPQCPSPYQRKAEETVGFTLATSRTGAGMAGGSSHCKSDSMEHQNGGAVEFDFDQGLIDVYSDLIAEINTDDFLDFGDEFTERVNAGVRDLSDLAGIFSAEELEEGEIVD